MKQEKKSCFVALGKKCWDFHGKGTEPAYRSVGECPVDSKEVDICYTDEPWIKMPSVKHLPSVESVDMEESNLILHGKSLPPSVKGVTVSSKMPWNYVMGMKERKDVTITVNLEDYGNNYTERFDSRVLKYIQEVLHPETVIKFTGYDEAEGEVPRPVNPPPGIRFDPYVPMRDRLQVKDLGKYVSLSFYTMPSEPPNMP